MQNGYFARICLFQAALRFMCQVRFFLDLEVELRFIQIWCSNSVAYRFPPGHRTNSVRYIPSAAVGLLEFIEFWLNSTINGPSLSVCLSSFLRNVSIQAYVKSHINRLFSSFMVLIFMCCKKVLTKSSYLNNSQIIQKPTHIVNKMKHFVAFKCNYRRQNGKEWNKNNHLRCTFNNIVWFYLFYT